MESFFEGHQASFISISCKVKRARKCQKEAKTRVYLPQYPSDHFRLSSPWHMCPNTCFSRTTCLLSKHNVKGELDCFNCKMGFFSNCSLQCLQKKGTAIHVFAKKNQLVCEEYLTIIRKTKCSQSKRCCCIDRVLSNNTIMHQFS